MIHNTPFVLSFFNTLRPEQNVCQWYFKMQFFNDNHCILMLILQKYGHMGPVDKMSSLVQVMACCLMTTSHYLNQYWLRPLIPHWATRCQWIGNVNWEVSELGMWIGWYLRLSCAACHSVTLQHLGQQWSRWLFGCTELFYSKCSSHNAVLNRKNFKLCLLICLHLCHVCFLSVTGECLLLHVKEIPYSV